MAALTEGWYIDGTDLQSYGTIIETRDGWDDTPPLRGENAVLLGRHGSYWRRKRFDAAKKTLTVTVNGVIDGWRIPESGLAQRALYEANLDALIRLVSPGYRMLSVERVHANGDRRIADCELTSALTPETWGNTAGRVSLEFAVPGAFWRDVDSQSYRLSSYDVGGDDSQRVEVYSLAGQTAPCADAIVTVTGPCTSVTIRDSLTGSGFSYGALSGGEELVVDAGAFSALKGGISVLTTLTLFDGQLLEMSPAPRVDTGPALDITAPGKSAGFKVVVEARRSWLR